MAEGNVLRKGRKNYFLSNDCNRYVEEIGAREGLNESAVIEVAVRRLYEMVFGERPSSKPVNVRPWDATTTYGMPKKGTPG